MVVASSGSEEEEEEGEEEKGKGQRTVQRSFHCPAHNDCTVLVIQGDSQITMGHTFHPHPIW